MFATVTSDADIFGHVASQLLGSLDVDGFFSLGNPFWEKHLSVHQLPFFEGAQCFLLWDACPKLTEEQAQFLSHHEYVVLNCVDGFHTEWNSRLLHKWGYDLVPEMMDLVQTLQWGCKVLRRVRERSHKLVSVVVPTHNCEEFLVECLTSILGQSHTCLEVIVVDDCSQDQSQEVVEVTRRADPRIHSYHKLGRRRGAAYARNVGLEHAVGDYLICFDSDDVMPPRYLATALDAFDEGIDYVYPRQWWSIPEDHFTEEMIALQEAHSLELRAESHFDPAWRGLVCTHGRSSLHMNSSDPSATLMGSCIIICSVFRASVMPRYNSLLPRLQDWDLYLTLIDRGHRGVGFFSPPYIRNRAAGITNSVTHAESTSTKETIYKSHRAFPPMPRSLLLPLNSGGVLDNNLAGPRIRGYQVAPHIPLCDIGDLDTLRREWRSYDVFIFVCAPTPSAEGWINHLLNGGKKVLLDICVTYWSPDYLLGGMSSHDYLQVIRRLGARGVTFLVPSHPLSLELKQVAPKSDIYVIPDSISSPPSVKSSYSATKRLVWTGYHGNITSLLAYTNQLAALCEKYSQTVRIISEGCDLRIPFPWEWKRWTLATENALIMECDIFLDPKLEWSSYRNKGSNKAAKAASLGMPIVTLKEGTNWAERLEELMRDSKQREMDGWKRLNDVLREQVTPRVVQPLIELVSRV